MKPPKNWTDNWTSRDVHDGKRHKPLLSKALVRSKPRLEIRRHNRRRNRRTIYEFYLDLGDAMGGEYGGISCASLFLTGS